MPSSRVTTWPTPPPFRLDRAEAACEEPMTYSVPATVTLVGAEADGETAVIRPAALVV